MHKSESLQENEVREILWDFETQTNHPIPTSLKRTSLLQWFTVPSCVQLKASKSKTSNCVISFPSVGAWNNNCRQGF